MHVVGTAGHVDHGKSALVEALTGIDPDRFAEEKRRGLTIDLGFAWRTLPSGREIGIVDVPGHERFIRNMLAGAGGVAVVLFIVAADEGWMPQSTEHLRVLDLLQVGSAVMVITKADKVEASRIVDVRKEIVGRIDGTSLAGAPIVAVSARSGDGLDDLVQQLDALLGRTPEAVDLGRPRLFVDRSFTIRGSGTVVTGTLTGGTLRLDDTVTVLPCGDVARVRTLHTHQRSLAEALPGSRVAANLVGVDPDQVPRGSAIVGGDDRSVTRSLAVRLVAATGIDSPVTERGSFEIHVGSAESRCRIRLLDAPLVQPGSKAMAHLTTEASFPLVFGDRFVIRDLGRRKVVAGGVVLDPAPGRLRRMDTTALDRLARREGRTLAEVARFVLADVGVGTVTDIARFVGMSVKALDALARSWPDCRCIGDVLVQNEHFLDRRERAIAAVSQHHADHPLEAGVARDRLRTMLDSPAAEQLLGSWIEEGSLVAEGNAIRLPTHASGLDATQRAQADQLLERLRSGGHSPPSLSGLGVPKALTNALERSGELVLLSPTLAYTHDVWDKIERSIVALIAEHGGCTVAQVRDTFGTTRRYAVPILEKLDSAQVTQRRGDDRILGPRGRAILDQPDAT